VYGGLRLEHAYRLLKTFNPANLEFNGKVTRCPTDDISTEIKCIFKIYKKMGTKLLQDCGDKLIFSNPYIPKVT